MALLLLRLLALAALLVMPFGMAAPASAHGSAAMAAEGHCAPDSKPDRADKSIAMSHCAGSCTALPSEVPVAPRVALGSALQPVLHKPDRPTTEAPEIATPPPKLS
jgi:hypothetical protein